MPCAHARARSSGVSWYYVLGTMRIAFLSPSVPWSFGPYQQQLATVAAALHRRGSHDVVWISMSTALLNRSYTEQEVLDAVPPKPGFRTHPLSGIRTEYAGTGAARCGAAWYTSSMNAALKRLSIDTLFSLMDHKRIFVDTPIAVPAYAWFPDHFVDLDHNTRHVLPAYAGAFALSPSSAAKVRQLMPYKRVDMVPHFVTRQAVRRQEIVRAELDIPSDAFVVFVTFANYDSSARGQRWRKGFDTALEAFRTLLNAAPRALLLVHSVATDLIFDHPSTASHSGGIDLHALIQRARIPGNAVRVHEARVAYHRVLELLSSSDVLLHPSRAEGFGMAVLEAQLLGVPVITTRFGAMGDYTFYGEAVPPIGLEETPSGKVAALNLEGVAAALVAFEAGRVPGNRTDAVERIEQSMSVDAVVGAFEYALSTPPVRAHAPSVQRVTRKKLAAAARRGAAARGGAITRPWVLLVAKGSTTTVDEDALDWVAAWHTRHEETIAVRVDASGTAAPAAPGGDIEATFILAQATDGSIEPPTMQTPVLLSRARVLGLLAHGTAAVDEHIGTLAKEVIAYNTTRAGVVVGAVPKPPGGC